MFLERSKLLYEFYRCGIEPCVIGRLYTVLLFFRGILETGWTRWSCRHLVRARSGENVHSPPIFPWDSRDWLGSMELPPSARSGGNVQLTPTSAPLCNLDTLPRLRSLLQTNFAHRSGPVPKIPRKNRGTVNSLCNRSHSPFSADVGI